MARKTVKKQGKAVGYVRVSTQEQATEGISLAAQRAKVRAYAKLHGLELVAIHADEGISGKRADNRPGLQAALEEVCHHKGVLVVFSLSRLARSTRDAISIAERIDKCGADLASISEQIDTSTAMGRFFFTTMAALAQLERDTVGERTKAVLAHKRASGEKTGGVVPFGYDLVVGKDGVKRLVKNDTEAKAVRTIWRLHRNGKSLRAIGEHLTTKGIKPKSGGKWHAKVVKGIVDRQATWQKIVP